MWRQAVLAGTSVAAVPFFIGHVHADAAAQSGTKVKACELSAYDPPTGPKLVFIDEEISPFRQHVSSARKAVWQVLEPMEASIEKVGQKYDVAKAHTADFVTYIREDPGALPRAGIITVAGLGGVIAAYRGGMFRKSLYGSMSMVAAAAICYPNQSVAISSVAWTRVSREAKDLWKNNVSTSSTSEKKPQAKTPPAEAAKESTDVVLTAEKDGGHKVSETEKDHGMSKPEDKEMYSTRGS